MRGAFTEAGLTPWEVRWRNACGPGGDVLPNGQLCDDGTGLKETLLAVKELCEARPDAGVACAMKNAGIGVGLPDVGRVRLRVEKEKAVIYTSAACMGQGLASVLTQFVAEKTGLERTHLYRKLKQLGVDLSRGKRSAG